MTHEWLVFSLILLGGWLVIFAFMPFARKKMIWASLLTAVFGLTEPLFVPEYWSPPSLFNLAARTGFDIESLIFSFAFGGIGVTLYSFVFSGNEMKISRHETQKNRHRFHKLAVISPAIVFPVLYLSTSLNPIYTSIISMFIGGIATALCRPDLIKNVFLGGVIFAGFYFIFFEAINLIFPYFVNVWNFDAISGIKLIGVPLEELMFGFTFGMMWSSIYEHLTWHKSGEK